MTETLKDMMKARAEAAPGPNIDVEHAIRVGRRRVWRHRTVGGTTACAAVAAVALVAPTILSDSDDSALFGSGDFETRKVTYAEGSTIHYGAQEIAVPHKVASFVQTDDGFVYSSPGGTVYLTDGGDSQQIGSVGGENELVADDFGSFVGWIEGDADSSTEAVVFDTARGAEVFRTSNDDETHQGCYTRGSGLAFSALDGTTAYICGGDGISAWNLTTGTKRWTTPSGHLRDVADGYLAWADSEDEDVRGTVVSRNPDAEQPRYRQLKAGQLSPDADYIWGFQAIGHSWEQLLFDRTADRKVELAMPEYQEWFLLQWIDNHRFTAAGYFTEDYLEDDPSDTDTPDLLTCDASSGNCTVVGQASGSRIDHPNGLRAW